MSARTLIILGLGALLAIVLALVLVGRPDDSLPVADDSALLPGLADRINAIDALEVVAPDGSTVATLHRERERWRMREKHDYEADFARIHDLLRDLARARRLEARTDKPQWYGRLGVAAPGEGEGSGVALRFPDSDLPTLIIGHRDPAGIGRYVRLENEARAWLTGQNLELPVERMQWLERAIMDIPAADIREVSIRRPGGESVELRPGDEEGSVWVMLDPPADRKVEPAWKLRQTANALARLNMADVREHDPALIPEGAVASVFTTRDGLVFTATTFSDDAGDWVHFGASADEPRDTDTEIDIAAVDGRLSPWQFALDSDRFKRLRPTVEEFLVAPEETTAEP